MRRCHKRWKGDTWNEQQPQRLDRIAQDLRMLDKVIQSVTLQDGVTHDI